MERVEPSAKRIKTEGVWGVKPEKREPGLTAGTTVMLLLQGQSGGDAQPGSRCKAPWMSVAMGAGNGCIGRGFLDACASAGGRLLILVLGAAALLSVHLAHYRSAAWRAAATSHAGAALL